MKILTAVLLVYAFALSALSEAEESLEALAKRAVNRAITDSSVQMKIDTHTPWHIVHGLLAYRDSLKLLDATETNRVSALEWVKEGGIYRNQPSFLVTGKDTIGARGPQTEFQGHLDQFAGYLSELHLPPDTPFKARGEAGMETRTWREIIDGIKCGDPSRYSQKEGFETSWALWALANNVDADEEWRSAEGKTLTLGDFVCAELKQDLTKQPCGGMHSLYAISSALKKFRALKSHAHMAEGILRCWQEADATERKYLARAKEFQNLPVDLSYLSKKQRRAAEKSLERELKNTGRTSLQLDGSFSANFVHGYGAGDWRARLPGNGHTLEWLMIVLPDSELRQPWVRHGVASVARTMLEAQFSDADSIDYLSGAQAGRIDQQAFKRFMTLGGYFHAAHALQMYLKRVNGK
ncbi:MAG: hypothetical protein HYZ71_17195 [Deltaproteobacteria bacterium]|nr:hypothetical protein [Deltaproteobacteria bacterium]